MRLGTFAFTVHELAGALGDYGTFLPFAVGYITVCGLDPAGFLLVIGLANIATGLWYRLPLPIEPQKVLGTVAIAQHWSPSLVYAAGFGTGLVWLLLGLTGWIRHVAERTPRSVVQGIQLTLGVLLAVEGLRLMATQWLLGLLAVGVILGFRQHRFAPAALVLTVLGVVLAGLAGHLPAFTFHLRLPSFTAFTLPEVYEGFLRGGLAQIPLTATNAILATAAMLKSYWPERPVQPQQLAVNTGIINTFGPFVGGMPLCHGAGGLAAQYYYGARTGGANILEGLIELSLGLLGGTFLVDLFTAFPHSLLGGMLCMVGCQLLRLGRQGLRHKDWMPATATLGVALVTNMALGFLAGVSVYFAIKWYFRRRGRCVGHTPLFTLTPSSKL
jgi:predicted benzoate:H+ symporter BenE